MNIEQERAEFESVLGRGKTYNERDFQMFLLGRRAALRSQDAEDAQEIASTLATVLHFIPKQDEPELYADIERLCGKFGDHARRVEGEGE